MLYYFHTKLLPSEYRLSCFSQEEVKNEVVVSPAQLGAAAAAAAVGGRETNMAEIRGEREKETLSPKGAVQAS